MPDKLSVIRPLYGTAIAVFCLIFQLLVFLLVIIGTPLDSFQHEVGGKSTVCLSMWGRREKCNHVKLMKNVTYKGMGCASSEKIMTAAAAFAIISIVFAMITLILCVLLVIRMFEDGSVPGAFAVLTFVSTLICWACQVGAFHRQCAHTLVGTSFKTASLSKSGYTLSASPSLFIAAWCLEVFVCVLIFIP